VDFYDGNPDRSTKYGNYEMQVRDMVLIEAGYVTKATKASEGREENRTANDSEEESGEEDIAAILWKRRVKITISIC
jgi:hypothetical protein